MGEQQFITTKPISWLESNTCHLSYYLVAKESKRILSRYSISKQLIPPSTELQILSTIRYQYSWLEWNQWTLWRMLQTFRLCIFMAHTYSSHQNNPYVLTACCAFKTLNHSNFSESWSMMVHDAVFGPSIHWNITPRKFHESHDNK